MRKFKRFMGRKAMAGRVLERLSREVPACSTLKDRHTRLVRLIEAQ